MPRRLRRAASSSGTACITSRACASNSMPATATEGTTVRADRKSTRLNSSHLVISYAVFCLKKKNPRLAGVDHRQLLDERWQIHQQPLQEGQVRHRDGGQQRGAVADSVLGAEAVVVVLVLRA